MKSFLNNSAILLVISDISVLLLIENYQLLKF